MIDHDNLEEFQDPANYDLEEGAATAVRASFYGDLALETGGPALEIACGSGLAAIPIAERGLAVTGVDLARPMLEHARRKSARRGLALRWVEADARDFDLGATFRFIFMTGNAFQAFLRREDQEALLASVRRHLEPDGIFAFETRNPSGHDLTTRLEEEVWQSYTSVAGQHVTVSGYQEYDALAQVLHWTTFRRWYDGSQDHTRMSRIACRFTYPQELEALLHYNGFRILRQYGDWQRGPLTAAGSTIISVCGHCL